MSSTFTEHQRAALNDYVAWVLRQCEMRDWRVRILDEHPANPDAGAEICTTYGRKIADIKLGQGFFDDPLEVMEHYLIHEVCHLFSEGIDYVVRNGPETLMGKPAFTVFEEQYRAQMELMTDALAYVLHDQFGGDEYRRLRRALKPDWSPPSGAPVEISPS